MTGEIAPKGPAFDSSTRKDVTTGGLRDASLDHRAAIDRPGEGLIFPTSRTARQLL
ncbi:hypothetical protein [Aeromonas sp. ASNIH1]|uniref:hypothetical protein n=1 Tax=Aeromonas sp. ASNIH1 TaxID=1636606 RepID=UPI00131559BE|nr:hypothetical protein [Aeromonas sp. ASNIH1]